MKTPSRKVLFAAGAVLAVLFAGGYALAQKNATGNTTADLIAYADSPAAHGKMGKMSRGAERCAGMGAFTEANGVVTGTTVSFSADAVTGTISSYAYNSASNATTVLVEAIDLSDFASNGKQTIRGGLYTLTDGENSAFAAMDGRRAGFVVSSDDATTVRLTLPQGATVSLHEKVANWSPAGATITVDGIVANLRLSKDATVAQDGNVLTVTLPAGGHLSYGVDTGERGGFGFHAGWGRGPMHGAMRGHDRAPR